MARASCAARSRATSPPAGSSSAPRPRSTRSTRTPRSRSTKAAGPGAVDAAERGPARGGNARRGVRQSRVAVVGALVARFAAGRRDVAALVHRRHRPVGFAQYVKPRVQLVRASSVATSCRCACTATSASSISGDFVSTAELANDNVIGGNPDLEAADLVGHRGSTPTCASATTPRCACARSRHFVDDVADFVPFGPPGEQIDAPGNIGKGSIVGAEVSLRVPLAPVLPGGTLNVSGLYRDTEVTDPVTGRKRKFSDTYENHIKVELRQDLAAAKLAWGTTFEAYSHGHRLPAATRPSASASCAASTCSSRPRGSRTSRSGSRSTPRWTARSGASAASIHRIAMARWSAAR